ncbi:hypothetical protein [Streptomyces anulatus]|uniref:hypothetical protein n=1 Tax=Streptomyces anulatus TaxID=1892 RepID=UPI003643DB3A
MVLSRSDLRTAFAESRTTRRATALFLFADSIVLHDADGRVEALRQEARAWLPRRLKAADPDLGQHLLDGQLALAGHADPTPLTTSVMRVLNLTGGPLREGYVDR